MNTEQKPTIGRIIHVRIAGEDDAPVLRPAMIVRVWGDTCVNAQVFLDGLNDDQHGPLAGECKRDASGVVWCTSISLGSAKGQWRWPARA